MEFHKLTKKGFGLNESQIVLLKSLLEIEKVELSLLDEIERQFPRWNFQIGIIGAQRKIAQFMLIGGVYVSQDDGKYHLSVAADTLNEAIILLIRRIPSMIAYCSNPKLCFSVQPKTTNQ